MLSAKRRAHLCKSIAIEEVGGVLRYFSKCRSQGSILLNLRTPALKKSVVVANAKTVLLERSSPCFSSFSARGWF